MAGYLLLADFKLRTVMPSGDVDLVEAETAGFTQAQLDDWSDEINDRLRKRYVVPFATPVPRIILRWLTSIVTSVMYQKRGGNPSDQSLDRVEKAHDDAIAELKEAADAKDGLFELPLRDDLPGTNAITKGPLGTSQQSPYEWIDAQAAAVYGGCK